MFGGAALQGGGYLRQSLLHPTGCYGRSVHRTWKEQNHTVTPTECLLEVRDGLITEAALCSHVPQCSFYSNQTAQLMISLTDFNFSEKKKKACEWDQSRLGEIKKLETVGAPWRRIFCSCVKAFNQSTPFHTQCYDPGLTRLTWINLCTTMHEHRITLHSAD